MKIFGFFAFLAATSANSVNFETRVSNGQNAKFGAVKCYTTLSVYFEDTVRTCGGCLISANQVLTSGNCVTSLDEGTTSEIRFAFGTSRSNKRGLGFENIKFPDSYNPLVRNSTADLALISLNATVASTLARQPLKPSTNAASDAYVGKKLFVCGYGHTNNKKKKPTRLQCTYLKVIPSAECRPAAVEATTDALSSTVAPQATTTVAGASPSETTSVNTSPAETTTLASSSNPVESTTTVASPGATEATTTAAVSSPAQSPPPDLISAEVTAAATTDASTTEAQTTTAPTTAAPTSAATTPLGPIPELGIFDEMAPDDGIICTRNIDDSNVCRGDEGSPVFIKNGSDMEFVGVVSHFPDVRSNAKCLDGHKVVITQVGAYSSFLSE